MNMKGYSFSFSEEECAASRLEDVDVSYKDLAEVCGRIRNRQSSWALVFLEKAADGKIPVLYKTFNRHMGHRRALGGKKGRYPKKAASVILKLLKSAISNGEVKGLGTEYMILHVSANKKHVYPRLASKGRQSRSALSTSRIEIVLKSIQEAPSLVDAPHSSDKQTKHVKETPEKHEHAPAKKEASREVKHAEKHVSKKDDSHEKKDSKRLSPKKDSDSGRAKSEVKNKVEG